MKISKFILFRISIHPPNLPGSLNVAIAPKFCIA